MIQEVLYAKDKSGNDGYKKIVAIKPLGWQWGSGELDTEIFGVLKIEIPQEVIDGTSSNSFCVNGSEDGFTNTPNEFVDVLPPKPEV